MNLTKGQSGTFNLSEAKGLFIKNLCTCEIPHEGSCRIEFDWKGKHWSYTAKIPAKGSQYFEMHGIDKCIVTNTGEADLWVTAYYKV